MENDLRGLLLAIQVAKHAMKIVWENAALVVIPNIGAVIAGVFLAIDPVLAIIINNGSAILAELNGLRPLLGPDESKLLAPSVDRVNLQEKIDRPQKLERTKTTVGNIKPIRDVVEEQRQSAPQSSAGRGSGADRLGKGSESQAAPLRGGCFELAQYVSLKVSA
jgi:hypothetical protein